MVMKEGVLVLSGSPHTSGESWSWRPRGLRGRLQQGGEEEEPRNSWIDQRCGRQQVWQFNCLQVEEVIKEEKQRRNEKASPSSYIGSKAISGYLDPMLE